MDHARHLASPSPTSSFLFHHSERPFKSSLLTPSLLSSASDVNHVDDCFSLTTTATSNNQTNLQSRLQESFGDNPDDRNHILVNHDDNNHTVTDVNQGDMEHNHHHQNHCVINHDSLNGVGDEDDEDDGMHNMLSGSSTSSTTTMPLLTENHSHHSFSRISLSEYSPLSLVDDCDNALTISPTSLVCGSHHSFKSSLNNLKLENLDGVDVHVDDVVGDARSMSPSLLSANTSSNQNQIWSISSTAITQNPTLLNNSSTSFLLSHHHHHHQLNSLMQQLEPQSLDESPPLIGHALMLETDHLGHHHHRPSSEPPPGSELVADINNNIESKSVTTKPVAAAQTSTKSQQNKSKAAATACVNATPTTSSNRSSRKNRSKTPRTKQIINKINGQNPAKKTGTQTVQTLSDSSYSSKAHLQLNHYKKLKELQQRLFGTMTASASTENNSLSSSVNVTPTTSIVKSEKIVTSKSDDTHPSPQARVTTTEINAQEAKSSKTAATTNGAAIQTSDQKNTKKAVATKANNKSRARQSKSKTKSTKNGSSNSNPSTTGGSNLTQKSVTTESVEPDTTTKSSDCIKLADLLSTTNSAESSATNSTILLSNNSHNTDFNTICEQSGNNDGKRIQHIQLQVSPSLKFMASGSLVQSMSVQQQLANNMAVVSSGCGSFNNQVICRPVNAMTSVSGNNGVTSEDQIKCNIMHGNDWLKSADAAMLSNCTNSSQSNNMMNGNTIPTINNNHAIGAHQIAIQVICQDGTSLVLPVSAASGLNAALSSASNQQQQQHQQLQAVLTSNIKCGPSQQQRHSNQILPLISVSNILAQQQSTNNSINSDTSVNMSDNQSSSQTSNISTQTTGLAASSPTLAALLDAGSNRNNNSDSNNSISHSITSSNLLRKFVGSNIELKRGEFSLQPGTQIGLTNNGSLVTICATNNCPTTTSHAVNSDAKLNHSTQCIGDKRIKLENVTEVGGSIQTTFTLLEPQGLIVRSNDNDGKMLQAEHKQSDTQQQAKITLGLQSLTGDTSNSMSTLQQLNSTTSVKSSSDNAASNSNKQNKMTSSTGNRQVDPTQPFRCEHCNSTFTRLGNFTRHKKIHSAPTKDGQRFKCDVCSKSFLQRCDLARHLHIHRGTEPHRCNICGKGYIRHSDLVTHQRFHNKEKPFGCPNCHKGFCQRGDLNRHLRSIHLQLKPLLCPCCNRKFAKRDTLLKHLSTHHRGYPIELLPP